MDTNALIAVLNGEAGVEQILQETRQLVPVVACGELYFGAANSSREKENKEKLEGFLEECEVVGVDLDTARVFGKVRAQLKRAGNPIPANDMWIASIALQHGIPLLSKDAHFDTVAGLEVVRW